MEQYPKKNKNRNQKGEKFEEKYFLCEAIAIINKGEDWNIEKTCYHLTSSENSSYYLWIKINDFKNKYK